MESDGEEEAAATPGPTTPAPASGRLKGCPELSADGDMREMAKTAAWSVSSCKPGNGVSSLRGDSLDTYWQSDGAQLHLVNIQFQKKVQLHLVVLYVDLKLDESYMASKISILAGDGFHNLKEIKTVDLLKPAGWVHISLSGTDPRVGQPPEREGHSCPTDQDIRASTEPCSPATIPLHFQGMHHILHCQMTVNEHSCVESAVSELHSSMDVHTQIGSRIK